jgi:hypothetical protein
VITVLEAAKLLKVGKNAVYDAIKKKRKSGSQPDLRVRAGGLERLDLAASVRDGVESQDVASCGANPSEPTRTTHVASLATALATATLAGDLGRARDLATQLLEVLAEVA